MDLSEATVRAEGRDEPLSRCVLCQLTAIATQGAYLIKTNLAEQNCIDHCTDTYNKLYNLVVRRQNSFQWKNGKDVYFA